MDILQAIQERNSVREYLTKEIEQEKVKELLKEINLSNEKSDVKIQLVLNENKAFTGMLASYGKFKNVNNYLVISGDKNSDLQEQAGYFGEKIVLKAQMLGLNTCWVAGTYSKGKCKVSLDKNEKIICVISLGYGVNQGVKHKGKSNLEVADIKNDSPEWFKKGVEYALLAPTAINQQKFFIKNNENKVNINTTGGFYSKIDLGIVKYHFEVAAGKENFEYIN